MYNTSSAKRIDVLTIIFSEDTIRNNGQLSHKIQLQIPFLVSVLESAAVDCGFEPRSGQTKDYEIDMCCFLSN